MHCKDLGSRRDCKEFHLAKPTGSSRVSLSAKHPDTSRMRQSVPSHSRLFPGCAQAGPWPCLRELAASSFPLGWRSCLFPHLPSGSSQFSSTCSGPNFPPRGKGNPEQPPFGKTSSSALAISVSISAGHCCCKKGGWERFWPLRCPQHSAACRLLCSKMPVQGSPACSSGRHRGGTAQEPGACKAQCTTSPTFKEMHPMGKTTKPILSRSLLTARSRAPPKTAADRK